MTTRINTLALLAVVAWAVTGCSDAAYEIERIREDGAAVPLDKSARERFFTDQSSGARGGTGMNEQRVAELLKWQLPEGWQQLPARQFRVVNMQAGEAECYVSVLTGGGVASNVNRWRGQMGQPPLDTAAIAALQTTDLLGRKAHRVDIEGEFKGRGGAPQPGYRMLAVYAQFPQFAMSVKMTGPAAVVAAQAAKFDAFCASLEFDRDKLAGMTSEPGAGAHGGGEKVAFDVPEGWTAQEVSSGGMSPRHASFDLGGGAECYITFMAGTAGGVGPNVNRWLGQIGRPALDPTAITALPELEILGRDSPLLEAYGDQNSILATITPLSGRTMFVKLTGPTAAVKPHKERFVAFCKSLREDR